MAQGHYIANVRDLEFNLFEVLRLAEVLDGGGYGDLDADTARTMLDEVARLAEGPVAASFVDADRNPPVFDPATHTLAVSDEIKRTVAAVKDAQWWRVGIAEEIGGVPAPAALTWAISEMLFCANPGVGFFHALGPAMAHALAVEGNEQQRDWAAKGLERGWAATMVLTEADAGSDVGRRPRESDRAARRQLAHRGRQAFHLRRRRRRHRGEHLPSGAGPSRGRRAGHQGAEPVLRAEVPVRSATPSNSASATACS